MTCHILIKINHFLTSYVSQVNERKDLKSRCSLLIDPETGPPCNFTVKGMYNMSLIQKCLLDIFSI